MLCADHGTIKDVTHCACCVGDVVLQSSRRHTVNSVRSPVYSVISAVSRPRAATTTTSTEMLVVVAYVTVAHAYTLDDMRSRVVLQELSRTHRDVSTGLRVSYASVDV